MSLVSSAGAAAGAEPGPAGSGLVFISQACPGDRLPPNFLTSVFRQLPTRDLAAAACACAVWRSIAADEVDWERRARKRWTCGWTATRFAQLAAERRWRELYRQRHTVCKQ